MKLIVGLGNPGTEYARTRHNIGRRLIEAIAAKEKTSFASKKKLKAALASVTWSGETVHLAYPLTYMNLSGAPVGALVAHFGIKTLQDILIVVDDIALPFGRLRLRGEGSSGGHNGLVSIEENLGSREYPRLRLGIGLRDSRDPSMSGGPGELLKDYVLSTFDSAEEKSMERLLEKGAEACRSWVLAPLAECMSRVNAKETE